MTKKQPHSDQSGRATRRREEREVERAQRTVARVGAPVGGEINIQAVMAKMRQTIGDLTMARDVLAVQLDQEKALTAGLQAALEKFQPPAAEGPPEPVEGEPTGEPEE